MYAKKQKGQGLGDVKSSAPDSKFALIAERQAKMGGLSDVVEVWPENVPAWAFFCETCSTQWRVGMGGPTGLDYASVLAAIGFAIDDKKEARKMFEDIQQIERGAIRALNGDLTDD